MSEKTLWSAIKKGLQPYWAHATRHEDMVGAGVADVSFYYYGNGWMELKEVKELPKRPTTGVDIGWRKPKGMTCSPQRHFLIKRHGFLLIRINKPHRVYLLFNHRNLPPDVRPYWTFDGLCDNAIGVWHTRLAWDSLAYWIRGNSK